LISSGKGFDFLTTAPKPKWLALCPLHCDVNAHGFSSFIKQDFSGSVNRKWLVWSFFERYLFFCYRYISDIAILLPFSFRKTVYHLALLFLVDGVIMKNAVLASFSN